MSSNPPEGSIAPPGSAAASQFSNGRRTSTTRGSLLPEPTYTAFLPVLLVTLALLFWSGFQTLQLVKEKIALQDANVKQDPLLQNGTKLRSSLDALAVQTKKLADEGNPNAKLLVDELKKRGITINPEANAAKTSP